ncbi:Uncharacterized protein dnm_064960 [Desulfonema magnum]|uniref:Uncharacterized protein n=1 Tax=Desulfonema magnum TaxID=45655 RepID=A0A975GR05_9BACT|nr:Uncharacterized protein dnm_064960 [Desulfonema magnum]
MLWGYLGQDRHPESLCDGTLPLQGQNKVLSGQTPGIFM